MSKKQFKFLGIVTEIESTDKLVETRITGNT